MPARTRASRPVPLPARWSLCMGARCLCVPRRSPRTKRVSSSVPRCLGALVPLALRRSEGWACPPSGGPRPVRLCTSLRTGTSRVRRDGSDPAQRLPTPQASARSRATSAPRARRCRARCRCHARRHCHCRHDRWGLRWCGKWPWRRLMITDMAQAVYTMARCITTYHHIAIPNREWIRHVNQHNTTCPTRTVGLRVPKTADHPAANPWQSMSVSLHTECSHVPCRA